MKFLQQNLEMILCRQAGIHQISLLAPPLLQSTIIKLLNIILDDKRRYSISQAFLEHDQSSHTAISVLKRVYLLKLIMKLNNIPQCLSIA